MFELETKGRLCGNGMRFSNLHLTVLSLTLLTPLISVTVPVVSSTQSSGAFSGADKDLHRLNYLLQRGRQRWLIELSSKTIVFSEPVAEYSPDLTHSGKRLQSSERVAVKMVL